MEEKKKSNVGLVIVIVILLLACAGMGTFIFINKDKLTAKEKEETTIIANKNEKKTKVEENIEKEEAEETTPAEDNNKYIEKVYSYDNDSFIFFKSGKCVIKSYLEYTAHCKYYIENNSIHITSKATGPNNGEEKETIYNIVEDNLDEYIELSTDNTKKYKYLKEYS